MASAAILRSVARSLRLRLRQPLEKQRCLMEARFLSSSVPTKRYPSSSTHSRETTEPKSRVDEREVYERLLMKMDKISDGLDEHTRLLKQLEVQMKEDNKNGGAINLTPWLLSVPASLVLLVLYNYVQG